MTSVELKKKQREGCMILGPGGGLVDFRPRYLGDRAAWRLRGPGAQPRYKAAQCRAVRRP